MEEDRKRTFETMESQDQKRFKPEEILGYQDDKKATTRLLLSRQEFSKLIGKGGDTIKQIRTTCGANVKGFDIDSEERVVIITGSPRQVFEAFEMVSELVHQAYVQSPQTEHFTIQMLLEHGKAGRVVGVKGAMIQNLKMKSGAAQIRMHKEPRDLSGVALRTLVIEGHLQTVRRAHFHVQELFVDPQQLAQYAAGLQGGPAQYSPGGMGMGGGFDQSGGYGMGGGGAMGGYGMGGGGTTLVPLPLNSLTQLGVQAETVRQLSEMKVYLSRQFGLEMSISREMPQGQAGPGMSTPGLVAGLGGYGGSPAAHPMYSGGGGGGSSPAVRGPDEVTFSIPRASVGGVIGKGGQVLKDLQAEFGIRIYVEKEEVNGMRTVVLKPPLAGGQPPSSASQEEKEAMRRCQERILQMSQEAAMMMGPGGMGGMGGMGVGGV